MSAIDAERLIELATERASWSDDLGADHEVGDLQELLRAAWDAMAPEQRLVFLKSERVSYFLDSVGVMRVS